MARRRILWKKMYRMRKALIVMAASLMVSVSAFAGEWESDGKGWKYIENGEGNVVSQWVMDDGKWYYLGENGYMAVNAWVGNYYVGSDGAMLTDTITPDGYYVGADGVWVEGKQKGLDPRELYQSVLNDYAAVLKASSNGVSWDELISIYDINDYWLSVAPNDTDLGYAFKDIDQNGIEELFIGSEGGLVDAFGYDGNKAVRLADLPGRGEIRFYQNGILETYSHGGVSSGVYKFYRMSVNGYKMDAVDILKKPDGEYSRNDIRISSSDFNRIVDEYEKAPWEQFSWTRFQ